MFTSNIAKCPICNTYHEHFDACNKDSEPQFFIKPKPNVENKQPSMSPNVGDVNSTERGSGARYNSGKPDFSLLPLFTLEEELRVWEYGKKKYAAWNWAKGMPWSVPYSSLMRHLSAWQAGEELDNETKLKHLAHAMCNLRMLMLYSETYTEGDDRPPTIYMKAKLK